MFLVSVTFHLPVHNDQKEQAKEADFDYENHGKWHGERAHVTNAVVLATPITRLSLCCILDWWKPQQKEYKEK